MTPVARHPPPVTRHLALLTLTILAGAFLRLFRLAEVPPGLHYDLAATALLGDDIAFGGARPVFITAYTGHEVLFYYWLAAWFRLVGSSVFTLRLAAALLGVLAIPCAYFAVRQVCHADRRPRRVAALAAVLLSFAFFHVVFSRFGFRVIVEPATQALALGFLWRGLRGRGRRRLLDAALGGAFTGLTAYTYLAARLFPFPIAIALLSLALAPAPSTQGDNRETTRETAPLALVFLLTAALVVAPLGWFFIQNPETLFNRVGQLAPRPGEEGLVWFGIRRAAEMIFIHGEPYDRYNLPGRPLFGPVLGAAFVLGLVVTLRRIGPARAPLARASEVLLLAWLPIMLAPTALAVHDVFPSNLRAFGLIPLLFVFPARGLLAAFDRVEAHWPKRLPFAGLAGTALLLGTLTAGDAYFRVWANLPGQYLNNDADLAAVARWLNAQDTSGETVYVSSFHYRHPTLAYLARDFPRLHSIYQAGALPVPESGPALYVFPRSAPPAAEWLDGWQPFLVAAPPGPDGVPDFRAYRFADAARVPLPAFERAAANFGNIAELTGFALRSAVVGEAASVDLRWRVLNPPEVGDLRAVADWVDAWGFHWSQGFNDAYPSEQWLPGETLVTRLRVPLPAGLPPGKYSLAVTLYSPNTAQSLPALNADGEFAGAAAIAGPIVLAADVPRDPAAALDPRLPLDLAMGDLTLAGMDPPPASLRPGERLNLGLYWLSTSAPRGDYLPRLTLSGPTSLVLSEAHPVHGTFPTSQWRSGQSVIDRYSIRLPRDLEPGSYDLTLDLLAPDGTTAGTHRLDAIEVPPVARNFEPPAAAHPLDLDFGGVVQLAGLDLVPEPPTAGQPFRLTLHWRALAETDEDYTAFVHILDSAGTLVAQHDSPPRDGAYPTSLWVVGEVVSDEHSFSLPAGDYTLEAGFYLPQNGQHLGRATVHSFRIP